MQTPIEVLRQYLKHAPTDCVASLLKQPQNQQQGCYYGSPSIRNTVRRTGESVNKKAVNAARREDLLLFLMTSKQKE